VPPSPSPSPTYGSISGNWTGTFNVSDIDSDCSFFQPRIRISELYATG
jgi:hypothetical protein